jgi:death on curing protein
MSEATRFLTLEDVIALHDLQIEEFGGSHGIRDNNLLESAIGMAQSSFGGQFMHETLFDMASAYAFHIAQNQAFIDGNKRTGLISALVFLDINGISLNKPNDKLYLALIEIAEKKMDKEGFSKLLQSLSEETR